MDGEEDEVGMLMKDMGHEMKWLVIHDNIKGNKARETLEHKG